jgi:hypothetical protein
VRMGTLSGLAHGLGETAGQDVRYDQSLRHRGNLAHRPILLDQHLLETLRTSSGRLRSWTIQGEMHDITTWVFL